MPTLTFENHVLLLTQKEANRARFELNRPQQMDLIWQDETGDVFRVPFSRRGDVTITDD